MSEVQKKRIVIGMSGGVDSSAAAALLIEQGWDVIGITLKLWPQDCVNRAEDKCCGPQAVTDARSVAHKLDIPFYLVDEAEDFQKVVINYFAEEYKAGRTPNPCVMCNERLKFGNLINRAKQLGADHIATGHYARVEFCPEPGEVARAAGNWRSAAVPSRSASAAEMGSVLLKSAAFGDAAAGDSRAPAQAASQTAGRYLLKRGRDLRKDQSYFLFSLRQEQLSRTLFPLGDLNKTETRDTARHCGLKTADKEESMEICFVPDKDYGKFLQQANLVQKHRGEIVDLHGHVLGHHDGIEFYTIGQRKGLGLTSPKPLYVVELDAAKNRVIVGDDTALDRDELTIDRCNWIPFEEPPASLEVVAKIRYNHQGTPATVTPLENGRAKVKLHTPQRAITPGQACVFYQDDLVVGGGWIGR